MHAKCSHMSAPSFYWFNEARTTMSALLCHTAFNVFLRHKANLTVANHSHSFKDL